jgi:hypothetical protein
MIYLIGSSNAMAKDFPFQILSFSGSFINLQRGFHPNLGWSHYRILMRVDDPDTRSFYEIEAAENAWSVRQLARQINSLFYERLLMSKDKREMLMEAKESKECLRPVDIIKDP